MPSDKCDLNLYAEQSILATLDDHQHGWIAGNQSSVPPQYGILKVFDDIMGEGSHGTDEEENQWWQQLPLVPAVTSVLLRQQNRRRWKAKALAQIDYCDSIRLPTPDVSWAVAKASLKLEHLSASFIVDASYFFHACCGPSWKWPNMTSLALTSQILTPDESPIEIDSMLQKAAVAAVVMKIHGSIIVEELLDAGITVKSRGDALRHLRLLNPVIRTVSLQQIQMEHRMREGAVMTSSSISVIKSFPWYSVLFYFMRVLIYSDTSHPLYTQCNLPSGYSFYSFGYYIIYDVTPEYGRIQGNNNVNDAPLPEASQMRSGTRKGGLGLFRRKFVRSSISARATEQSPFGFSIAESIQPRHFHLISAHRSLQNRSPFTMGVRDSHGEATGTPDPVEKGFATLNTIRIGVKAMVQKDGELRKAEILSIRQRKDGPSFYVHYVDFNKRLDEWVDSGRLDLSQEVEWPQPEKPEKKKAGPGQKAPSKNTQKRPRAGSREVSATPDLLMGKNANVGKASRPSKAGGKENRGEDTPLNMSILGSEAVSADGTPKGESDDVDMIDVGFSEMKEEQGKMSREEEIERLRTSGSMTQNPTEIHRVRNLNRLQMGKFDIEPWYFSPYPTEYSDVDIIYIDEFCLSYFDNKRAFERHRAKCTLVHPPGNEIYRDDNISFFEVDGRRQRTWCRNLCLLSKLFLDHKTLYYDVDPFLFYCMCTRSETGCHLVGYFSKEKDSAEGYNLACILTLPQYQRRGFGRLLIAFSYELSKREGKLGSPEKPLSDLGLLGYRQYWRETLVELLIEPGRESISENELAVLTSMTEKDVHETLVVFNMLRYHKANWVIVLTDNVVEEHKKRLEKEKIKGSRKIDPTRLQWKPPVFTASSRTWNW
ncbi:NuA4 histone acetyltransferase complex catalytic subunit ESA1 [Aspergillus affinis]|uniref:NuA4 histone acetyltransferase complex catalytic subunit ESA1 n=1 Tax=Aspergillus affinis TaxID=1070780 RepID=UPI0022FED8A2|nr:uncharacterized protein KD926_010376 [Aspergillus affinis]KAI9045053.1 hypothetical protein KD926_010376 [Aspergillus affinis]